MINIKGFLGTRKLTPEEQEERDLKKEIKQLKRMERLKRKRTSLKEGNTALFEKMGSKGKPVAWMVLIGLFGLWLIGFTVSLMFTVHDQLTNAITNQEVLMYFGMSFICQIGCLVCAIFANKVDDYKWFFNLLVVVGFMASLYCSFAHQQASNLKIIRGNQSKNTSIATWEAEKESNLETIRSLQVIMKRYEGTVYHKKKYLPAQKQVTSLVKRNGTIDHLIATAKAESGVTEVNAGAHGMSIFINKIFGIEISGPNLHLAKNFTYAALLESMILAIALIIGWYVGVFSGLLFGTDTKSKPKTTPAQKAPSQPKQSSIHTAIKGGARRVSSPPSKRAVKPRPVKKARAISLVYGLFPLQPGGRLKGQKLAAKTAGITDMAEVSSIKLYLKQAGLIKVSGKFSYPEKSQNEIIKYIESDINIT